jgi:hypothetical protein
MSNPTDPIVPDDKRAEVTAAIALAMQSVYGEKNQVGCVVVWCDGGGPVHLTSNLPVMPLFEMLGEAIARVAHGPAAGYIAEPAAPPSRQQ